jgi:hypothetical protein
LYNNAGEKQAFDDTNYNLWNTSTEGNFWSDWSSPDNNSDGIVDSFYMLDGGGIDFFPIFWTPPPPPPPVPEPSPAPLIIVCVLLVTALVVRLRKR